MFRVLQRNRTKKRERKTGERKREGLLFVIKILAHVIMESEKSQAPQLASWRPRKPTV